MKKRILALVLALLLIVPMIVSCGDDGKKKTNNKDTNGETGKPVETVDAEVSAIDTYLDDITASHKYDGVTFNYIGRTDDNFPTEEEETGALLSDAVYHRQRELEERFGLDWENIITEDGDHTKDDVIQNVMAGQNAYDLVYGNMITVGQRLVVGNVVMDVSDFETLDLTKEWWVQSLDSTFRICNKLYFLTGPIVVNYYVDTTCILFNKQTAENYNITGLYDLVTNNEWTTDKMFEVASVIPTNETGSGAYRYMSPGGVEWMFSNGMTVLQFDEDNKPFVEPQLSAELSALADKMSAVLGNDTQTVNIKYQHGVNEDPEEKYGVSSLDTLFERGDVLFNFDTTGGISGYRELDVEFGVLPMPMGDKNVGQYHSYANSWTGGAVYVPKTVKDVEMVDVVVEAMGALSQKHIKPAYYDKLLKGRSTYDIESRGMIDIIFRSKIYDIIDIFSGGDMNQWGDFMDLLDRAIRMDSSSLASAYGVTAKLTNRNIDTIVKRLEKAE